MFLQRFRLLYNTFCCGYFFWFWSTPKRCAAGEKKEEVVTDSLIYIETCMFVFALVRSGGVESAFAVTYLWDHTIKQSSWEGSVALF